MKHLVAVLLMLCILSATIQAQELPNIPGTELQWGMSYDQVQLPGTHMGNIVIQQQPFAEFPFESHPIIGQYYFSPENQLEYVQYNPNYQYPETQQWQADYDIIEQYVTHIYGEPKQQDKNVILWETPSTQGRLIMAPRGWITRFDQIEVQP